MPVRQPRALLMIIAPLMTPIITVIIVGRGAQPSFTDLESGLETALRRPVIVTLEIVPVEKNVSQ